MKMLLQVETQYTYSKEDVLGSKNIQRKSQESGQFHTLLRYLGKIPQLKIFFGNLFLFDLVTSVFRAF